MKLRWGILGTARINGAIIPAVRQSKRGALIAVASRDHERAAAYSKEWSIPRSYGSYDDLIADPEIDVIYNSLPNSLHAEWSIKALEAGKHVLCEKPFALTLADVDAMFEAARQNGRVIADGFMYRHHPRIWKARELVLGGAIGEARLIKSSFSFLFDRPGNSRWDPAMGGGALWDIGCYCVSIARYIFNEAPEKVMAWSKNAASGIDELFVGTMIYSGDRVAQFDCSFSAAYRTHVEIVGTDGTLTLHLPFRPDEPGAALILRKNDIDEFIDIPDNPWRYLVEVEELHAQILDGKPAEISDMEIRDNIETILKLYEIR